MSFFSGTHDALECGAIVDIGSGSVGIAIVIAHTDTGVLDTIWSHREYMLIKEVSDIRELLREINTALINALLELGNAGLKTLKAYNPNVQLKTLQVSVCAPWSYTVTKTIQYEDEKEFEVTPSIIKDLVTAAEKQTAERTNEGTELTALGLRIITEKTIQAKLNGYLVTNPIGKKCTAVSLSHVSAAAQEKILTTLEDSCEKILPGVQIEYYSFMYVYFQVLKHLKPNTSEICLIDVTNEATEVGIVRDNILQHTTHIPFGMYEIARRIATECSIPKEEAFGVIKNGTNLTKSQYTPTQQTKIEAVFTEYQDAIAKLFLDTGDSLSIPRMLFIHTTANTEQFFSSHIQKAAHTVIGDQPTVHLVTAELLQSIVSLDSALAISSYFFNKKNTFEMFMDDAN